MQGSIDFSGVLSGAISGEGGGSVPVVTATATVDNNTGVPEVAVTRTGSDENPNFNFGFKNLKGAQGDPGTNGTNGSNGSDGFSPAVTITDISNGHRVSITDATHPSGQIFDVMNGNNGRDGSDGQNGTDGVSPAVTIGDITGGHSVTIIDATHPLGQTFNVMNGQDGATGATGATGPAGPGLPAGGAIGQIIYKASNTDYHTEWGNIPTYDADDISYDPTGRTYVTETKVQGAIDELDSECAALNNSLTKLGSTLSVESGAQNMNVVEKWGSFGHFSLQLSSMTGITGNSTVATIPNGYKPKHRFKTVGFGTFNGALTALVFAIETDGTIVANHGSSALTTCCVEASYVID